MRQTSRRAFTLIELLIVVAIIAILAAIAVPNFLEAQIRAKVSRVKSDARTLATAVEIYAVDNTKYPLRRDKYDQPAAPSRLYYPPFDQKIMDTLAPAARVGLRSVTSPIAYITSLPVDVFNTPARALVNPAIGRSDCLDYWDPTQTDIMVRQVNSRNPFGQTGYDGVAGGYVIISVGPDSYLGLSVDTGTGYPDQPSDFIDDHKNTFATIYDPTNGTVSKGNVMRFRADLSQQQIFYSR